MISLNQVRLGIIGLGYVGLPLAVEFGKHFPVVGFDIDSERITELSKGHDHTLEVEGDSLSASALLTFTNDSAALDGCNVFIVTTPTPVDEFKRPDLEPVLSATRTVGQVLKPGGVVLYESTVYPGATEEECVPILERLSGLAFNNGFFVGYSPERISPGDKLHRLTTITKITSGSTPEAADFVNQLYESIIPAGTYRAPSIKVAEAAKVIENTQRDVNIALVNELAMLFTRLNIDTTEVLTAAGTKWNFLHFAPGLVGGHCIGVDPYYLTHKAQQVGYRPDVILASRRVNDSMGTYVADQLVKVMVKKGRTVKGCHVLLMGLTFKENCPDLRNTRVIDIIDELRDFGVIVDVHDPWADPSEAHRRYGIDLIPDLTAGQYDAVILTVAHNQYTQLSAETVRALLSDSNGVVYDVKGILPPEAVDRRL